MYRQAPTAFSPNKNSEYQANHLKAALHPPLTPPPNSILQLHPHADSLSRLQTYWLTDPLTCRLGDPHPADSLASKLIDQQTHQPADLLTNGLVNPSQTCSAVDPQTRRPFAADSFAWPADRRPIRSQTADPFARRRQTADPFAHRPQTADCRPVLSQDPFIRRLQTTGLFSRRPQTADPFARRQEKLFARRPVRSQTRSLADPFARRPVRSQTRSLADPFARRPVHLQTRSLADLFTCRPVHLQISDLFCCRPADTQIHRPFAADLQTHRQQALSSWDLNRPSLDMAKIAWLGAAATFLEVLRNW
ncbi:hypothetical protein BDP27DRAFT_1434458 [Rhodocollybia butyracea]|uniref:Uncharacterized protein n=1 Tax=Rhodocollybia butyracea TaxID=206335 RepID=A0A9P5TWC0_9AGAR|nr:hypothetical protein BDP27DRAFT_1434458 [Rhodocollybia butyracea]